MHSRFILILSLLLVAVSPPSAQAEELRVGHQTWGATITFPKDWESDNYMGHWSQGWTGEDRKVWLSAVAFQKVPPEFHARWLVKHCDTFGVEITVPDERPAAVERRIGDLKAEEYRIPATWEENPIEVTVLLVHLAPQRTLIVTIGGSPADRLKHKATLEKIIASIRVAGPLKAAEAPKESE